MSPKVFIIAGLVGFASAAAAQNVEVVTARQEVYKGMNAAAKPVGQMLKGDVPLDLAVVQTALKTFAAGTKKLPGLFPDDSKTGHDTAAKAEIWANKEDFNGRMSKLSADSEAALASITDQASFTATMPKILGQCGACHKEYRAK